MKLELDPATITIKFVDGETLELHNVIRSELYSFGRCMMLTNKDGIVYDISVPTIKYYSIKLEGGWYEKVNRYFNRVVFDV